MTEPRPSGDLRAYLEAITAERPAGARPRRRPARPWSWVDYRQALAIGPAAAVVLLAGATGCGGELETGGVNDTGGASSGGSATGGAPTGGTGALSTGGFGTGGVYGIPYEYDCDNDFDDDYDGALDCADSDCFATPECSGATGGAGGTGGVSTGGIGMGGVAYGIPFEYNCGNDFDDDYDGALDCADVDCGNDPLCAQPGGAGGEAGAPMGGVATGGVATGGVATGGVATGGVATGGVATGGYGVGGAYGIPYESICNDGYDNDYDTLRDCEDPDCFSQSFCTAPAYGVPMENCTVAGDEDYDGAADCADADCFNHAWCMADYAAPLLESSCTDGLDNDGDTDVDCLDEDCATHANCRAIYAVPFD